MIRIFIFLTLLITACHPCDFYYGHGACHSHCGYDRVLINGRCLIPSGSPAQTCSCRTPDIRDVNYNIGYDASCYAGEYIVEECGSCCAYDLQGGCKFYAWQRICL